MLAAIERDQNTIGDYDIDRAIRLVTLKLVGYTEVVHALAPHLDREGSILLFGGLALRRPYPGSTTVTTVNGGVEGLVRTLAVQLAPVRVNAIHPGIVGDTPEWAGKPEVLEAVAARTPIGRPVTTDEIVGASIVPARERRRERSDSGGGRRMDAAVAAPRAREHGRADRGADPRRAAFRSRSGTARPRRPQPLVERGAGQLGSPDEALRKADVCVTVLADDSAFEDVVLGEHGVLAGARAGTSLIDMSTISVAASERVAGRAAQAGVGYLRAPVSGSPVIVRGGTLTIIVSGPRTSRPTFVRSSRRSGPRSSMSVTKRRARVAKLVLQILIGGTAELLGEALVLGERAESTGRSCSRRSARRWSARASSSTRRSRC